MPSNAFLVIDCTEKNCVVIDPGSNDQGELKDFIRSNGLTLDYFIITHEHFDRYWGVNILLDAFPAKVIATKECAEKVLTPQNYFNELYFDSDEMFSVSAVDVYVEDIDWRLPWKNTCFRFVDAKGHT